MTHPDYRCPGCNLPLEPIAQIRTYHSGCDPQGRVEMLERALQVIRDYLDPTSASGIGVDRIKTVDEIARRALAYRPAQMKGRE